MATGTKKTVRKSAKRKVQPAVGEPIAELRLSSMKPNLYLDIVGTLVLQEGSSFRLAPFAREFITEVREHFHLEFLTSLSEPAAIEVAELLEVPIAYGTYRRGLGKVSGIDFSHPFLWIDDAPTARDLMRLAEERCSSQLITVNGKDGVTRVTLGKVENCLEAMALVSD